VAASTWDSYDKDTTTSASCGENGQWGDAKPGHPRYEAYLSLACDKQNRQAA
jgi:hypothetical protein